MHTRKSTIYTSGRDSLKTAIIKVWEHKNLIWVFAKRDIQVKYSQTYLGIIWSFFKPLLSLFIYVLFFGIVLKWQTGEVPYAVYVLSGLIGCNLFSYIVNNGVVSVHESSDIIKKIYFPKSILPFSKMLVGIVDALISLVLLLPLMLYYEVGMTWKIIFMPLVLLFNAICGLSISFLIAAISIKKRDILQVLPFLIHMAIWFTPVFLSTDVFPEQLHFFFSINPIANVIELWRWVLFDGVTFQWVWVINFFTTAILLLIGFYFYTYREDKFADFI